MATLPDGTEHLGPVETAREAFWVIALAVIAGFAFFYVLGAYSLGDVVPIAIAVAVLAVLWIFHGLREHRVARQSEQSTALRRMRERRGF